MSRLGKEKGKIEQDDNKEKGNEKRRIKKITGKRWEKGSLKSEWEYGKYKKANKKNYNSER